MSPRPIAILPRSAARARLALAALAVVAAAALTGSPAEAASRDTARVEVRIEDELGGGVENRRVTVRVDEPAAVIELRTDPYGRVSARVPVAQEGSTVTVDLSGADVVGDPLTVAAGVVPRDRVEVEVTSRILAPPFEPEPQDEEFYEFDADGDGFDDALYRWPRAGLPDVIAVDVDADGVGIVTERVGAGDMLLSVADLDLDGADEVLMRSVDDAGHFTGSVWIYDPGTGDEDSFTIGDGSGGWVYFTQLDGQGGLDPWWVPDPNHCGTGAIERILGDGTRQWIDFPDAASGFPHALDLDGDHVSDLRCQTYAHQPANAWTIWLWSSEADAIASYTADGSSALPPFLADCDADGEQETVIPGEYVWVGPVREQVYRGFEFGGLAWTAQMGDYTVPFACPTP